MPVDDAFTVALLHMNGADAGTTFTDESGKSWTANGNAQIDTAQSKFGGASGLFDGTGDYLSTGDSADFAFGSGDFTIDFWIRWNSLPGASALQCIYNHFVDTSNVMLCYLFNNAGTQQWVWQVWSGGAAIVDVTKNTTVSVNTWYHIALVRTGNDWKIFQNGTQVSTTVTDTSAVPDYAGSLLVGQYNSGNYFNGWLDEYRISKGIARWTADFAPPTSEYGNNSNFFF